jgi:hypothetical protein
MSDWESWIGTETNFMINEIVEYSPDNDVATEIRVLFCRESLATNPSGRNPLIETDFNNFLKRLTQIAFDEGRTYERKHSKHG